MVWLDVGLGLDPTSSGFQNNLAALPFFDHLNRPKIALLLLDSFIFEHGTEVTEDLTISVVGNEENTSAFVDVYRIPSRNSGNVRRRETKVVGDVRDLMPVGVGRLCHFS